MPNVSAPELADVHDLIPDPDNPRVITTLEREELRASIREHGNVEIFIVHVETGLLIGGHARRAEMISMIADGECYVDDAGNPTKEPISPQVWVRRVSCSAKKARRLNVALNAIGGDFDPLRLGHYLDTLDLSPDDPDDIFLALGLGKDDVFDFIDLAHGNGPELPDGPGVGDGFAKSITLSVAFDTVAERDEAKELLTAISKAKTIKAGNLILEGLRKGKLGRLPAVTTP